MKVRRIHPNEQEKETLDYLLSLTYEERLLRHKALLEKIYADKWPSFKLAGLKVYRKP